MQTLSTVDDHTNSPLKSITQALNMSSMILMVCSPWTSIWGWKVVLSLTLLPNTFWNTFQKWEVYWLFLFKIIDKETMNETSQLNRQFSIIFHYIRNLEGNKIGWFSYLINNDTNKIMLLYEENPQQILYWHPLTSKWEYLSLRTKLLVSSVRPWLVDNSIEHLATKLTIYFFISFHQ